LLEARIIAKTHWTYQELMGAPSGWLMEILTCWSEEDLWQARKMKA
jgi:hypothetical protein